jgi:hypothetical protein
MRDLKTEFGIQLAYLRGRGNFPEATIQDAERKLAQSVDLQVQYNSRVDALTRGGELTTIGLKKALRSLGLEFRGKLKFLEDTLSGLAANIAQVARGLQPPTAPAAGDATLQYLKEMEIRQGIKAKDPLELQVLYREQEPGSPLARALENSPIPVLPAELIAEVHLQWARQANPEVAKRLEALQELQSLYDYAFKITWDEFPLLEVEAATVAQA